MSQESFWCMCTHLHEWWIHNSGVPPWAICQSCASLFQSVPAWRSSFPFTYILPLSLCFCPFRTKLCPSKRLKPGGSWRAGTAWGRGESWHWAICLVACSVQGAPHCLEGFIWSWLGLAFFLLRTGHSQSEWRVWSRSWYKGKVLSSVALDMLLAGM